MYQLIHGEVTSTKVTTENEGAFFRIAIIYRVDLVSHEVRSLSSPMRSFKPLLFKEGQELVKIFLCISWIKFTVLGKFSGKTRCTDLL
uniref:Uncharacterized protein n=1 Tax=Medicago truncatula TaxID=3880 RepID=I3S6W1_MEDTR|nr:unknown [Medicago truncatula]